MMKVSSEFETKELADDQKTTSEYAFWQDCGCAEGGKSSHARGTPARREAMKFVISVGTLGAMMASPALLCDYA